MKGTSSTAEIRPKGGPQEDRIDTAGDVRAVWKLFRHADGMRRKLGMAIGLVTLSSASFMVSAKFMGSLVETLVAAAPQTRSLALLAAAILLLEIFAVTAQYFGRVGLSFVTNEIAFRVRRELFQKLTRLPISYFDHQPLGRTLTRLTADVEGIESFFSGTLARLLMAGITIVVVMIAMVISDWFFGLVVIAVSLPALAFTIAVRAPLRRWLRVHKKRGAALNARLAEFLNAMPLIRIFGLESWAYERFRDSAKEHLAAGLKVMNWNSLIRPAVVFLCTLPVIVILWWGGQRVLSGTMSLGLVVAFIRYSERFAAPVRTLTQEIQVIQEALASSERVSQMLEEPEEQETLGPDGLSEQRLAGRISFRDIWMSYNEGKPVLKSVSFEVRAGTKVGLVGETGSGKSTTLNLLPRLYPFSRGEIQIDGLPIDTWCREALRRQLGVVSQDVVIFRGTLRENLTVASETPPTDEAVLEAAKRSGLLQIMEHFPAGLDTPVLEGGENLSMGERQLVALTRMLIRNPSLLILDEATANIDERCEQLVQKAIQELLQDRTCFIIAHRLSTILLCDEILVFRAGEIVERGNHAQLMKMGGRYAELANAQLCRTALQTLS